MCICGVPPQILYVARDRCDDNQKFWNEFDSKYCTTREIYSGAGTRVAIAEAI